MTGRDLEQFRRVFRAGERVTGKVLSRPDARHAWVDISGYELLARTDTAPPPGAVLSFFIDRISPVVVLRELPRPTGDPPDMDPRRVGILERAFLTAREATDELLPALAEEHRLVSGWMDNLAELKARFLSRLRNDAKAWAAYSLTARLARDIAALTAIRASGRFLYAPWYPPGATEHELFLRRPGPGGVREILADFRLPGAGLVRIKALLGHGAARCLISAQSPGKLPPTALVPDTLAMGRATIRLEPLSEPRLLPPTVPSLLAGLLAPRPGGFTGVNLRV